MPVTGIALCGRCRRETLPQRAKPSWHREKHRAAQSEREPEPSTAALKAQRKKERRLTRKEVRALGIIHTTKLFLAMKAAKQGAVLDENCPECLKLQSDAA